VYLFTYIHFDIPCNVTITVSGVWLYPDLPSPKFLLSCFLHFQSHLLTESHVANSSYFIYIYIYIYINTQTHAHTHLHTQHFCLSHCSQFSVQITHHTFLYFRATVSSLFSLSLFVSPHCLASSLAHSLAT